MSKNQEKSYHVATSKGNDGLKITLSGDLSLNNIKRLKDELSAHINISKVTKIIVIDVENIDLGLIQLIQSFVWTTRKNNNQVDVELNLLPDHQKLLSQSGIKLTF
ncbi:MAG: hypothetical protein AB7S54_05570 [Bacteroidales bacterium]